MHQWHFLTGLFLTNPILQEIPLDDDIPLPLLPSQQSNTATKMRTKKSKLLAVIMAKAPVFIAGLITLSLLAPLPLLAKKAKKKEPVSQVKLTSNGRKLDTDYSKRMKSLKSDLDSAISKIDKKRKDYYLEALEAYTVAENNLNDIHNAEGMVSKAQGLVNHAKGKWIGGADHQIKRVKAELKSAKNGASRSKAEKELEKWEKNREEGVKELKERQAILDKALSNKAHFKKNLTIAQKALKEAKWKRQTNSKEAKWKRQTNSKGVCFHPLFHIDPEK